MIQDGNLVGKLGFGLNPTRASRLRRTEAS